MMNNDFDTLIVGDLHAMTSNMEDTGLLLDFIENELSCNPWVRNVIFLGDIFHTHSVIRQEVAHFLRQKIVNIFDNMRESARWFLLAGNHDGSSPYSVKNNAVRLVFGDLRKDIIVVDNENFVSQYDIDDNFVILPFIGDNEKFVSAVQKDAKILFCHQTIKGAVYENGHIAPGGVDQSLIPQDVVISGHIHFGQQVGKVWYPGTPRALNANEYNENKGIWLFDTKTLNKKMLSTNDIVKCFIRLEIEEGVKEPDFSLDNWNQRWKPKDDVRIQVTGSESFYRDFVEKNKNLHGRVRLIPNIRKTMSNVLKIDENNENMHKSLHKYVFDVYEDEQENKEQVWKKLQSLIPNLGNKI